MTKQIVQTKKINKSLDNIKSRKLSIQFSLDGFSFSINNQENKIIDFVSYSFDRKLENPIQLLKEIETIFSSEKLLQQDFESVLAIHQNNLATFVPNDFFDDDKLSEYLKHNIKVLKTDFITFDTIDKIEAKNVYIPYVNVNNYLFQNFGEFEYKHHLSVLVDKLLEQKNIDKKCFININKTSFDVVVIENSKLLFSNTFNYQTKQDFIYYLLFVAEQLKLDTEQIPFVFIGKITKDSILYAIAYKYIRNIEFIANTSSFFNDEKEILPHQHYLLIH